LQLWRNIDEAIGDESTLRFQRKVSEAGAPYLAGSVAKVRSLGGIRRYLAIAASVLILVSGGLFVYQQLDGQERSGSELYASNYTSYDLSQIRTSETAATTDPFAQGVASYAAGDFQQAAALFAPLTQEGTNKMKATFALAHAYLNQTPPKTMEAEVQLRAIITDDKSSYVSSAKWYLALIHLQREEVTLAKPLLAAVQQAGGKLGKTATEILAELE
jgi:outer membrane PBP1 activator LpoA protein